MVKYVGFLNKINHVFLFWGLNVFFVLHSMNSFLEVLQLKVVASTLLALCILSFAYWFISLFIFRNKKKASLFTAASFFVLLFYNLVQLLAHGLNNIGLLIGDKVLLGLSILLIFLFIFFSGCLAKGSCCFLRLHCFFLLLTN